MRGHRGDKYLSQFNKPRKLLYLPLCPGIFLSPLVSLWKKVVFRRNDHTRQSQQLAEHIGGDRIHRLLVVLRLEEVAVANPPRNLDKQSWLLIPVRPPCARPPDGDHP